ncbi:MAG: FAD:protein FMN transferase [Planctomycetaceae bacterium]|nr:FAD:protein FMN transferase [Planctomycetaceae bacterium]
MSDESRPTGNRREFLTGRAVRKEVEWVGEQIADEILENADSLPPAAGPSVRLGTTAMAADFVIMMNPGPAEQVMNASDVLEEVHQLEQEMTVYKSDGELFQLNQSAEPKIAQEVSPRLFEVVRDALEVAHKTEGAYDPTSGPLIDLWRLARRENRVPTDQEINDCLKHCGHHHVSLDAESTTVAFHVPHLQLNLGGIGKGFALDVLGEGLLEREETNWMMHGGKSSLLAHGSHHSLEGWPVGVRNPLFPKERLATILLRNQGMSTSGAGVQFFRHEGKRYGHILDPRTGIPAENVLSVTVLAPSAAVADALSTAFFVMGLEKTREYCDNFPDIGVLLIPPPKQGRRLQVHTFNLPDQTLFLSDHSEQIDETL